MLLACASRFYSIGKAYVAAHPAAWLCVQVRGARPPRPPREAPPAAGRVWGDQPGAGAGHHGALRMVTTHTDSDRLTYTHIPLQRLYTLYAHTQTWSDHIICTSMHGVPDRPLYPCLFMCSGKTSLLEILGGRNSPTQGGLLSDNRYYDDSTKMSVGFVPQVTQTDKQRDAH